MCQSPGYGSRQFKVVQIDCRKCYNETFGRNKTLLLLKFLQRLTIKRFKESLGIPAPNLAFIDRKIDDEFGNYLSLTDAKVLHIGSFACLKYN